MKFRIERLEKTGYTEGGLFYTEGTAGRTFGLALVDKPRPETAKVALVATADQSDGVALDRLRTVAAAALELATPVAVPEAKVVLVHSWVLPSALFECPVLVGLLAFVVDDRLAAVAAEETDGGFGLADLGERVVCF